MKVLVTDKINESAGNIISSVAKSYVSSSLRELE